MRNKGGCCARCARAIPGTIFSALFTLFNLGLAGLGGYLIKLGLTGSKAVSAEFVGTEIFQASLGLGGLLIFLSLYGIFGPCICAGNHQDHVKCFVVFGTLVLMVFGVFTVVTILNSEDSQNLTDNLDFGWERFHRDAAQHYHITNAQTALHCCGFFLKKLDRKVDPCPSGATRGCEFRLRRQLQGHLNDCADFFAISAGALLLVVLVGYCYAEQLQYKDNLSSGRNESEHQDPVREPILHANPVAPPITSRNDGVRHR